MFLFNIQYWLSQYCAKANNHGPFLLFPSDILGPAQQRRLLWQRRDQRRHADAGDQPGCDVIIYIYVYVYVSG